MEVSASERDPLMAKETAAVKGEQEVYRLGSSYLPGSMLTLYTCT